MTNIHVFKVASIPPWYPGSANAIDSGHVIRINTGTYYSFKNLTRARLSWMYNFFFTQANFAASENFPAARLGGLYTQFTPPGVKETSIPDQFGISDLECLLSPRGE